VVENRPVRIFEFACSERKCTKGELCPIQLINTDCIIGALAVAILIFSHFGWSMSQSGSFEKSQISSIVLPSRVLAAAHH
jgi:hypothetical protein